LVDFEINLKQRRFPSSLTFPLEYDIFPHNKKSFLRLRRRENRVKSNLQGMMKEIQDRIAQTQSALERMTVTADAGGGMIKVTANGRQQITKIEIEKEVVNPEDIEMLEDLISAAVNKALEESSKLAQEEMAKATSGLLPNIPGLSIPGL
jgi:DNA-binding YbaB/EbfC family protein